MTFKIRYALVLSLVVVCLTLVFISSCRKLDKNDENVSLFTIENATSWWNDIYKNSKEFTDIDNTSENVLFLKALRKDKEHPFVLNKKPNFKLGISYKVGRFQFVEFPLIYENKATIINAEQGVSMEQNHKIAESKLEKVIIIKSPNGTIEVRIMTITPTYNYLVSKGFDITENHSNYIDKNFSGTIQVRRWNEKIHKTRLVENGKVKSILKNRKYNINNNSRTNYETPECPQGDVQEGCVVGSYQSFVAHVCPQYDNYSSGDVVNVVACGHSSGANTYICSYFVCEQYEEPVNCDTHPTLTNEDCMCLYYDISYCDDAGGEGDVGNTPTNPCDVINSKIKNDSLGNRLEIQNMGDSANNGKTELGMFYRRDSAGSLVPYQGAAGNYGVLGINISLASGIINLTQVAGFWHNHFSLNNTHINMFTTADLLAIVQLRQENRIPDLANFFFGVTLPNGQNYMLMIDSTANFNTFCQTYSFTDPSSYSTSEYKLGMLFERDYLVNSNFNGFPNYLEHKVASFLKDNNIGMQLFDVNLATNKFTKISPNTTSNSSTPIESPCN